MSESEYINPESKYTSGMSDMFGYTLVTNHTGVVNVGNHVHRRSIWRDILNLRFKS
jgi:hypothetical protein